MKKILSKFEKNERMDNSISGAHQREASSFIGKVFTVGRTVVSVEDVLAEGQTFVKMSFLYQNNGIFPNLIVSKSIISCSTKNKYKKVYSLRSTVRVPRIIKTNNLIKMNNVNNYIRQIISCFIDVEIESSSSIFRMVCFRDYRYMDRASELRHFPVH